MTKQLTAFTVAAGLLLALASGAAPTSIASPTAGTARVLQITDTAKLRYIPPTHGSVLFEEGAAQGTLPGTMRVHCTVGATVRASFTISTRTWSISGHGSATPHGSGRYESFAGTLVATSGTGRYAHANGHAGFYGTFDRRSYALVVQTTGSLHY
jgi:hypothetical protein